MTDNRSFMSVTLPAHHNPSPQPHPPGYTRDENADYETGYAQDPDVGMLKRRPSSYNERSFRSGGRPATQAYGASVPVQLPSLNGVFHDPTRTLYGPGTSSGITGPYGSPLQSDENSEDTSRLPLSASTPSPQSPHDYHHHHQQQFHQENQGNYSQAPSYRDHHPNAEHRTTGTSTNIASSSSSPSNYTHSRQHLPHVQMLPSMLYSAHSTDASSSSAYARTYTQTTSHSYAHSHSSSSLSPQSGTTAKLSTSTAVSHDDRQVSDSPVSRANAKRREKPKIDLAPDQPLTTQGKPRARVYVACVQCRTRKIRCDGAKPVCHNCSRRTVTTPISGSNNSSSSTTTSPTATSPTDPLGPCCYDSAPKRRGPDKNPGSRQRVSHAQRELEVLQQGLNGTADGGKVRKRRRRDTTTNAAAGTAGAAGAAHKPLPSSSRVHQTETADNQPSYGPSASLSVDTNVSTRAGSAFPTNVAAHLPVGGPMVGSGPNIGIGTAIPPGSGSQAAPRPSERVPPSLHLPAVQTTDDLEPPSMPNPSPTAIPMGSPELYRAIPGQGQRHGPHSAPHSMPLSQRGDARGSAERAHALPGDRYSSLPSNANQRSSYVTEHPYSSLPLRVQVSVQSQAQHSRPLRSDLSRLISPIQEYHQPHPHPQHPSPQGQLTSALNYVPYHLPPHSSGATISPVDGYDYDYENENTGSERKPEIEAGPSGRFTRETWWDALLGLYFTHTQPHPHSHHLPVSQQLTPGVRESLSQRITADFKFLFRTSNYWFSFVNVPRFFARILDPRQRTALQPSFIFAALACANFIRSSEQEDGEDGRNWALMLLERAQSSLEASVNTQWIDESLVQASWLIAFFEISAHPMHNTSRVRSALTMLDSLIRSLSMSVLDSNDQRTSRFGMRTVPTVASPRASTVNYSPTSPWTTALPAVSPLSHASLSPSSNSALLGPRTGSPMMDPPASSGVPSCHCESMTLGANWTHSHELTPLWLMTPAWHGDGSDAEIRKEECRRVVWSAVTLVAGYTSFVASINAVPAMELFLMEPANFALLFPGETLVPSLTSTTSAISPNYTKHTVWALYMRTMLLWHSCVRMRWDTHQDDASKAEFAVAAWLEIDKIEKALDSHTCHIERAFLFQGREYLFNARMCISFEFQRFIPHATANANMVFHRRKAEDWLNHQASVAKRTMYGLQTITGQPNVTFARRPFFVFWFMSQVSRALLLWSCDNTLTVALDVSKALLGPIEYLMSMWPCADQQRRYRELRANLDHACLVAGVTPPSPYSASSARLPLAQS